MSKDNKWKEHLLKSGIPLEYEIKNFLDKKGCISNFEFTYFRNNQENQRTEFSYDIDSSYIRPPYFVELMIECKYRHESTKWLFLPEAYEGPDEIGHTSFMHPNDHFINKRQLIFSSFPFPFAPLCSKGVELTTDGPNPKTITQAVSQLSYAIGQRIITNIEHNADDILSQSFNDTIFCNVPIIVTSAQLFRIKESSSIVLIKNSSEIEEIAEKVPALVIKSKAGVDLINYNKFIFRKFIEEFGREKLQRKLNSFNTDLDFVMSVIAENYSPSSIAVIHYSENCNGLEKLFEYIDRVINPDEEIFSLINEKQERISKMFEKLKIKK